MIKILSCCMYYSYGVPTNGTSYEYENFYRFFEQDHNYDVLNFDYVTISSLIGVDAMSEILFSVAKEYKPDVVFLALYKDQFNPRRDIIGRIKTELGIPTINWFFDDNWRYDSFSKSWAPYLTWIITCSKKAKEKYDKDGFGNKVILSQHGYNHHVYNYPFLSHRSIPVVFIGQKYGNREEIISSIRKAGIDIRVYGIGWGRILTFKEMIGVLGQSHIVINIVDESRGELGDTQIKGRVFEATGCGALLMTSYANGLEDYFNISQPNEEIVVWHDNDEMINKIQYYLKEGSERKLISIKGHKRSSEDHTYENRFKKIFREVGLWKKD